MVTDFKAYINQHLPFLFNSKLIVALSGGIDSVVLAHLCKALNLNFVLAHCNFNLRGNESKADETFVLQLAKHLNVEVFVKNFDTQAYADDHKKSIQMAARELRYNWFNALVVQLKFNYILTAHHADDNLETFLINFTRGTGLNGLTGIPVLNGCIARPLLQFSRKKIEAYAIKNKITWRIDSSNASKKYLRNKLRLEVVPILKEINPRLLDSFKTTLDHLNGTADIVKERLNIFKTQVILKHEGDTKTYKISAFKSLNNPKAYLFELFKAYGFTEWNDSVDLLDAETGKYITSNTHRLIKHRDFLLLTPLKTKQIESVTLSEDQVLNGEIKTPLGILSLDEVTVLEDNSKTTIYVDKERLNYPLELRIWQNEDVFYPLGMAGKKKMSKYLKDEKQSVVEKENTWVLTSCNAIVWVVGMRADHRFKITDLTKKILKITLKKET